LSLLQVDNAHAIVAELRHEESLPGEIDGEMIDPPRHMSQQYLGIEDQRHWVGRQAGRGQHHANTREQKCSALRPPRKRCFK